MTEVSFAKNFLALLDARPIKLSSDHVADPRQLPAQSAYILPRNPKPYVKRAPQSHPTDSTAESSAATQAPSTRITLRTVRPTASTPPTLTLPSQPLQSSIFDLKAVAARRTGYAPDKIKILWEKRPVADSKTLQEVVGSGVAEAEMGVMFVGQPTAAPVDADAEENAAAGKELPNADAAAMDAAARADVEMKDAAGDAAAGPAAAQGKSGWDVCETDEFWADLTGFVTQRVRDEGVAKKLVGGFRAGWRDSQ